MIQDTEQKQSSNIENSNHWLGQRSTRFNYSLVLLLAVTLNISALLFPFMHLRQGLNVEPYSLMAAVQMMWQDDLWVLSFIIILFSIVFPFLKLGSLALLIKKSKLTPRLRLVLVFLERAGKWSMVDIFIVSFILALAKNQWLLDAKPSIGLISFLISILLSMSLGALFTHRMETAFFASGATPPPKRSKISIGVSAFAFLGLLFYPFIAIDDWLLRDQDFTVLQFLWALASQDAWLVSMVLLIGLVLIPAYELYLLFRREMLRSKGAAISKESTLLLTLRPWSLIDVFLFSLLLFLLEGENIMGLKVGEGALFLLIVTAVYLIPFFKSALSKIKV